MTHSERMKQQWRDPAARQKMLAGGRKGAQARREVDQRTRAEHSYRCRRARSRRFQSDKQEDTAYKLLTRIQPE